MNKEQKFYSILQNLFVGAKLEGESGYVNLMNIKTDYFNKIKENIKKEVEAKFDGDQPEDLFDKLYTFFDSYFSDGGAIFFSSTPVYKNIYAKVYSDREDTALFWKTAKLYYVKSEANYKTIKNLSINSDPEIAFDFAFDVSLLKHKQANEKKELEFYFIGTQKRGAKKIIKFRVLYKNDNKYTKLQDILKIKDKGKITKYLLENIEKLKNSKITLQNSGLDFAKLNDKSPRDKAKVEFVVSDNLLGGVAIEPAIFGTSEIEKYLKLKNIKLNSEEIDKAFKIYKKQTEIDYFIHKDAKGFLREQFDLYMYQHLTDHRETFFRQEALDNLKKIKEIAYLTIDFIGNFEDELKKIWLKPKFARNSNYVLTLDRIVAKKEGIEVIAKILKNKGFKNQVLEWQELGMVEKDFDKKEIIKNKKLNKDWQFLPIDTKYFKDLEIEIIGLFDNLDEELDGRLIKSDNFQALNTLKEKYKEKVQTIYIDPPFNTGDDFAYIDRFQDSTWLTLMENRLELSANFLKNTGNYLLHLDENANQLGKILIKKNLESEISNEIIWDKGFRGTESKSIFQHAHDTIFFIKMSGNSIWNQPTQTYKDQNLGRYDKTDEDGRKYALIKRTRADGSIYYGKTYPKEEGKSANDVVSYIPTMASTNKQRQNDFKTQKPEELMQVFIEATSNLKDTILDFFGGSGTTLATAHKSQRKWAGVEMGNYFEKITLIRMKEVLAGKGNHEPCGISQDVNWQGGGFFKYYELEQYEDVLKKANYNPTEKELQKIDFNFAELENGERIKKKKEADEMFALSEKLADSGLEIDLKKEEARFVFEKLYPDVDIAETISNVYGEKILKITKDKVILENREIDLNNLDFEKYEPLKKLIYW
ncbi:MAG: site-specific DNA-methyltransferase [Candidatus Falkowbacteria bacterium]